MSILIKGMEMPENCAYCPCEHYECGLMGDEHNGVDVTAYFEGDKRHPNCPLIEVPKHGDLIDRYAAIRSAFKGEQNIYCWDEIEEAIDSVPAIIESEE